MELEKSWYASNPGAERGGKQKTTGTQDSTGDRDFIGKPRPEIPRKATKVTFRILASYLC